MARRQFDADNQSRPLSLLAGWTGCLVGFVCLALVSLIAVNEVNAQSPMPDLVVESVTPILTADSAK